MFHVKRSALTISQEIQSNFRKLYKIPNSFFDNWANKNLTELVRNKYEIANSAILAGDADFQGL